MIVCSWVLFNSDTVSKAFITLLTADERVADSMSNFVKLLPHVAFASWYIKVAYLGF